MANVAMVSSFKLNQEGSRMRSSSQNWTEMRMRWVSVGVLTLLGGIDGGRFLWQRLTGRCDQVNTSSSITIANVRLVWLSRVKCLQVSTAGHVAGIITGVCIGFAVLVNLKVLF